jgi:xanthine dehydrogenase accessory factor
MVDLFAEIVRLHNNGSGCALATVVRTAGSTPRKAAARMLVRADGSLLGTIGGGRIEKEVTEAALALLAAGSAAGPRLLRYHLTHELAMCCGGEMEVFVEPLIPEPLLIVCGGGHVAQALVPVARACGFAPVLVEEAEEMATPERFPDVTRIVDSFDVRDWHDLALDGDSYVVIVTRDHAQDQALLEQLLSLPKEREPGYLGLIGSRRKIEMFRQRLTARGVDAARLGRVHAPIGLDIGADTPAEIAVAIVGELIQERAARRERVKAATAAAAKAAGGDMARPAATAAKPARPGPAGEAGVTAEPGRPGTTGGAGVTAEPARPGTAGGAGVTTEPARPGASGGAGVTAESARPGTAGGAGVTAESARPGTAGGAGVTAAPARPGTAGGAGVTAELARPGTTGVTAEPARPGTAGAVGAAATTVDGAASDAGPGAVEAPAEDEPR